MAKTPQPDGSADELAELKAALEQSAAEANASTKEGEEKIDGLRDVLGDEKVESLLEEYRAEHSQQDQALDRAEEAIETVSSINDSIIGLKHSLGDKAAGAIEALEHEKASLIERTRQDLGIDDEAATEALEPESVEQPPEAPARFVGLQIEHVMRAVSVVFNTSPDQLASSDKPKALANARNTVAHLSINHSPDSTWPAIGKALGREGTNLRTSVETGSKTSSSFRERLAADEDLKTQSERALRIAKAFEAADDVLPAEEHFGASYVKTAAETDYDPTGGNPARGESKAIELFREQLESLIPTEPAAGGIDQQRYESMRNLAVDIALTKLRHLTKATRHYPEEAHTGRQFFDLSEPEVTAVHSQILLEVAGERIENRLYTRTNQEVSFFLIDAAYHLRGEEPVFDMVLPDAPDVVTSEDLQAGEQVVIPMSSQELADASESELLAHSREGREEAINELTKRYRDSIDDLLISDDYEMAVYRNATLIDIAHGALPKAFLKVDLDRPESFSEQVHLHVRNALDNFVAEHISSEEAKSEFAEAYFQALWDRFARFGKKRNIVPADQTGTLDQAGAMAKRVIAAELSNPTDPALNEVVNQLSDNSRSSLPSRTAERLVLCLRSAISHPAKPVNESFGKLEEEVQEEVIRKVAAMVGQEMSLLETSVEKPGAEEVRLIRPAKDRSHADFKPGDPVRCPPFLHARRGKGGELSKAIVIASKRSEDPTKSDYVILEIRQPDGGTHRDRMDVTDDLLLHEKCLELLAESGGLRRRWRNAVNTLQQRGAWPIAARRHHRRRRNR